jgi:hypothetical protein
LSKIPTSILKTPVPPTIVLPVNHQTMEWTTRRGHGSYATGGFVVPHYKSRCLSLYPLQFSDVLLCYWIPHHAGILSSLHHQRSLSKIPTSILKTPVPPTIVLPVNHQTMEWTTRRGSLSINSRCLQNQPTNSPIIAVILLLPILCISPLAYCRRLTPHAHREAAYKIKSKTGVEMVTDLRISYWNNFYICF